MNTKDRYFLLDVIRGIAVILVFGRHLNPLPESNPLNPLIIWHRGGWVGVDIFFVLSGFLVSGLLFREYLGNGQVDIKRFLIRRAFKIYPPFYFLLAATMTLNLPGYRPNHSALLCEVVYLQNYCHGIWNTTWSLAVEEQFYILLALVFVYLLSRQVKSPLSVIPKLFCGVAVFCLVARLEMPGNGFNVYRNYYPTHIRLDSLAFGVLLAYLYWFHQTAFLAFGKRFQMALLAGGMILLAIPFVFEIVDYPFVYTFGYSLFYLGSGAILTALISSEIHSNFTLRGLGWIGIRSYSIYLWHYPVVVYMVPNAQIVLGKTFSPYFNAILITVLSILIGAGMNWAIERPMLLLRDKITKHKSQPILTARI